MSDTVPGKTVADVQAIVDRSAYLTWLGLRIERVEPGIIDLTATWRPEWVANPDIGQTQGGILASVLDFAANFSLIDHAGGPVPTVDLRIDYHRLAKQGDLVVQGRAMKTGRQISWAEAVVYDRQGNLLASGRGTFMTVQKPK
ncbi:phenylacetic acid degradation protein [Hoeflea sp. BAL378]|uniref:PaaI family thioesterase n=1 Tax=Hoeflea sp. BAL378 TaxID=1547437 RepID=UPI00051436BF|nr:PaaI family thioesterase [Hoeflea sp. BAL378]KGF71285.1 phenylacetic acid degradation protein [Hoeflea sp. BAL378]